MSLKKKHFHNFSRSPYQLEPPINYLKRAEVQEIINSLGPKKSSGYDLITGKALQGLPIIGIKYLTQLFNAVLLKGYFLAQWKVSQIILIIIRLLPKFEYNGLITNQCGFRQRHSTIEQTHRIVQRINEALENKQYCSAAFLDISQAFNKVWHSGLLYKLRLSLPLNYFLILKSYLHSRHLLVKVDRVHRIVNSQCRCTPRQGNVLRPLVYLVYTADLPTSTTATFADDTAIVATDSDPAIASHKLQTNQLAIQNWFKKWRMKANGFKSIHVTFTTRSKT
jgi:hypothetical protein